MKNPDLTKTLTLLSFQFIMLTISLAQLQKAYLGYNPEKRKEKLNDIISELKKEPYDNLISLSCFCKQPSLDISKELLHCLKQAKKRNVYTTQRYIDDIV